jgi:hypothetical protein
MKVVSEDYNRTKKFLLPSEISTIVSHSTLSPVHGDTIVNKPTVLPVE